MRETAADVPRGGQDHRGSPLDVLQKTGGGGGGGGGGPGAYSAV